MYNLFNVFNLMKIVRLEIFFGFGNLEKIIKICESIRDLFSIHIYKAKKLLPDIYCVINKYITTSNN